MLCPSCGSSYIGGNCPNGCARKGVVKSEDEITKKIVDDSDLIKGG